MLLPALAVELFAAQPPWEKSFRSKITLGDVVIGPRKQAKRYLLLNRALITWSAHYLRGSVAISGGDTPPGYLRSHKA